MAQAHTFAGTNFVAYPITTPDGTVAYLLGATLLDTAGAPASISGGGSGGTATAAAPAYVEGATSQALSLDLSGRLRVLSTITGTLPAFAATPTFNLGTLNGAALDATIVSTNTKLDTLHTDLATTLHADLIAPTPAGTNLLGKVGLDQTTPGTTNAVAGTGKVTTSTLATYTNATFNPLAMGTGGQLVIAIGSRVAAADAFANNTVSGFNTTDNSNVIAQVAPSIYNGTSWDRQKKASTTARLLSSAATTNATSVKASAGDLFKIVGNNTTATKRYLKLYNKASAPTVGTDTPVLTLPLPGSAAFDISITAGYYFSTGIAFAITGAAADADTTAVVAGDIECLNLVYA